MSLLNKSAVRQFALDYAKRSRAQPFERVSSEFMDKIEADLREAIRRRVNEHPSVGKTLR